MPLEKDIRTRLESVPMVKDEGSPLRTNGAPIEPPYKFDYADFQFDSTTDLIDSGGNAVVYKTSVEGVDQPIALKQPPTDQTITTEASSTLSSETRLWARVDDHAYIATVYDSGESHVPWVAVEYLDGGTLAQRIDTLGFQQRLWTAYAITDAVAYATGQEGITHHDLTPTNILFDSQPPGTWDVPKVVDWGLSETLRSNSGSVDQATPDYAAPEQLNDDMADLSVGVHTDVYQLGVICYELLTGVHPDHFTEDITPPTDHNSDLPTTVDEIVLRALSTDRKHRFEHPLLFREKLADVIRDTNTEQMSTQSVRRTDSISVDSTTSSDPTPPTTEAKESQAQTPTSPSGHTRSIEDETTDNDESPKATVEANSSTGTESEETNTSANSISSSTDRNNKDTVGQDQELNEESPSGQNPSWFDLNPYPEAPASPLSEDLRATQKETEAATLSEAVVEWRPGTIGDKLEQMSRDRSQ